jgi:hypothetical protein
LGEKALLTHEGEFLLIGAGWEFFNPEPWPLLIFASLTKIKNPKQLAVDLI